ncbi:rhomboid family intramembrane serine protease [Luteolibacter sp. SL250]|uniref:rhomboid family intramembrane serine protease n=1 Tax=Luteolibacter sp. SL250 TaxID=2995170 RepID=UPI00226D7103|nr:rhomboid family intramembrane serine protease [Luteolibacter sp. SL250]WAC19513.1 rhomboid family intramembrane serine protease [Luteolibacter sp. SL250]
MEALTPWNETLPALCEVGVWTSIHEAHEHALVLLAMGWDCSVHPVSDGYALFTAAGDAEHASRELGLYAAEQSRETPLPEPAVADHPAGIMWLLAWGIILTAVFSRQLADPALTDRFSNSTVPLLEQGEWWRPFTALFLHGDLAHLLGNLLIGGLFCIMAAKSLGAWKSWPLILLGGTVGNLVNALFHQGESFSSIGASTATFAALGLLVGLALANETLKGRYLRLRSLAVPLISGSLIFSMFGTAGENTDVSAHVWGGLSGVALGAFSGWLERASRRDQDRNELTCRCMSAGQPRIG